MGEALSVVFCMTGSNIDACPIWENDAKTMHATCSSNSVHWNSFILYKQRLLGVIIFSFIFYSILVWFIYFQSIFVALCCSAQLMRREARIQKKKYLSQLLRTRYTNLYFFFNLVMEGWISSLHTNVLMIHKLCMVVLVGFSCLTLCCLVFFKLNEYFYILYMSIMYTWKKIFRCRCLFNIFLSFLGGISLLSILYIMIY